MLTGIFNGSLLGDSGYALEDFLFTPYLNPDTVSKQRYNSSLVRTRVLIEQANGILKMRFPCLRDLRATPQKAIEVTVACAILHNIAQLRAESLEDVVAGGENDVQPLPVVPVVGARARRGTLARDNLVQQYFA